MIESTTNSTKCLKCGCSIDNDGRNICSNCEKQPLQEISDNSEAELNTSESSNDKIENTVNIIAETILYAGIAATVIIFFSVALEKYGDFNLIGFGIAISTLVSSVITWAVLKVLCNISNNLREINKKIK